MNINYEYYRIFYYVCKYGSFTGAADILCSSQPNVTRSMNRLEDQLGCRLFIRSNRGTSLTPEGETLLAHVQPAIEQLQRAEEELAGVSELQSGSITIGASETALNIFLLSRLGDFHRRYPGIRIHILNHSTPQAVAALTRGTVDLAVVTTPARIEKNMQETHLDSFRDILIGNRDFVLPQEPLHMKDLENYPLISLGRDTMTWAFYRELFLQYGIELRPDTEAATADQILPLVRSGLGLAFLPEAMASGALERGEIVRIPLEEEIPERYVNLIRDRKRPLSLAAREFAAQLTKK
ncbi:MAG: LysR family transcriptional regulator [Eubacteriaceae bacterium]